MSRPGTRRFVGPLTPAQQRRRDRARAHFARINSLADAWAVSIREALLQEPFANDWLRRRQFQDE